MTRKEQIISRFAGKHVTVIGIGVSNLPLIGFLLDAGAIVTARDKKPLAELSDEVRALCEHKGLSLVLGEGYLEGIEGDYLFRSPGMRPDEPHILRAIANGAILTSEMELFFSCTPARILGVTGSDGKTTTTTLTHLIVSELLRKTGSSGKAYVGGNIGAPLLPRLYEMTPDDIAIVELSSFQLQTMTQAPTRSVITNITPNHLNWHTGMEEYTEAKKHIYTGSGCSQLVANLGNEATRKILRSLPDGSVKRVAFSRTENECDFCDVLICRENGWIVRKEIKENRTVPLLSISDIKLPGDHNIENTMAAIGLAEGLCGSDDDLRAVLHDIATTFGGVEHRLEFVRRLRNVDWYNSSIDSSPTRTAAALRSFPDKSIVLCGGYDKHIPFAPLAEVLAEKASVVILSGATAQKIADAIAACPACQDAELRVIRTETLDEAIRTAYNIAHAGERVILSPACASFDAFKNFEERGKMFKDTVARLPE